MTIETKFNIETNKDNSPEWLRRVKEYYGGETHSHSKWSNREQVEGSKEKGVHNEKRLLEYVDKLGLDFVVFSEHASDPNNPVELKENHPICESLLEQKKAIAELNLSGNYKAEAFSAVEASIFFNAEGQAVIDVPDSVLSKMDLVVASRHAISEQREPAKIKESLFAAANNPEVDIIGHAYRYIEFYENDWNYFKEYYQKDSKVHSELEELEKNKQWDLIKQIIGKEDLGDNKRIKKFNELFVQLKDEYWQVWDESLMLMEKNGKAFEINLNSFDPNKDFYQSLLKKASEYQNLSFSISYDFHNLEQLANINNKDSVSESPVDIKNPGRAKAVQRLLDLINLLESLGIGPDRIVNSSSENLEMFIEKRGKKRNKDLLERSEYKEFSNIELMARELDLDIINMEVEKVEQFEDKIVNLLIKYHTADGTEYFLKKNDDYDMQRLVQLMQLMNQEIPNETNEILDFTNKEVLIYKSLEGEVMKEKIVSDNEHNRSMAATKSAELIVDFHDLDVGKFKAYINDKNYSIETVRHSISKDLIAEIGKYDNQSALELDELYEEISKEEENILAKSNLVLVHGDFHPGNVLIDTKGEAKLTDYKNLTTGVRERDIASMLEQVYGVGLANKQKIQEEDIVKWQEVFLNSYKDKRDIDEEKLIFYRSWISWRNAIYCLAKYFLGNKEEIDLVNGRLFINNTKKFLEEYKAHV